MSREKTTAEVFRIVVRVSIIGGPTVLLMKSLAARAPADRRATRSVRVGNLGP